MASNKQLIDDILLIKPDALTEGLKSDDLAAMLKDLRAKAAEAKPREYKIAAGKSVTSKKGILGPGVAVKPEYFPLGQETIDTLIDKGFIV